MDSDFEIARALHSLQFQIDEGVDECILMTPISRFDLAKEKKKSEKSEAKPISSPTAKKEETAKARQVDYSQIEGDAALIEALFQTLDEGLQKQLHDPIEPLGEANAEIFVLVDPPKREAVTAQSLEGDPAISLLRKSLQAISIDIDSSLGKEPRASMRIVSISPWRIPQDRKFLDGEAVQFLGAIEAMICQSAPRAILLAGSNLAGIDEKIEEGKLFDRPVFELISPSIMLREPLLKKQHWQRLLAFHNQLGKLLEI